MGCRSGWARSRPTTARAHAATLRKAIGGNARLAELAQQPLLLTLMVRLQVRDGGQLPHQREALYDEVVTMLLDEWEGEKCVRDATGRQVVRPSLAEWLKTDPDCLRRELQRLAFEAHRGQRELRGTADIPRQRLIDRVYREVFEGRWNPAWERMLDDPRLTPEDKLIRFYLEYGRAILQRDWVRIFIHSGLSDRSIPDRFFALLREKLFPRLVRETRRHCGVTSRAKPSAREFELMMGLHGGIFYIGMRRWVYEQAVYSQEAAAYDEVTIRDRVRSYLASAREVLHTPAPATATPRKPAAARRADAAVMP